MEEALEERDALINNLVEKIKHLEDWPDCLIQEANEKISGNECDFKTYHKQSCQSCSLVLQASSQCGKRAKRFQC